MFILKHPAGRSLRQMTASGTVAPGDLVVLSGSSNVYAAIADNAVAYDAVAVSGAATTATFWGYDLGVLDELLATSAGGTYAAGMEGDFFGVSAAGTLDLDNTSNKALRLLEYDATTDSARVQTIAAAVGLES